MCSYPRFHSHDDCEGCGVQCCSRSLRVAALRIALSIHPCFGVIGGIRVLGGGLWYMSCVIVGEAGMVSAGSGN